MNSHAEDNERGVDLDGYHSIPSHVAKQLDFVVVLGGVLETGQGGLYCDQVHKERSTKITVGYYVSIQAHCAQIFVKV